MIVTILIQFYLWNLNKIVHKSLWKLINNHIYNGFAVTIKNTLSCILGCSGTDLTIGVCPLFQGPIKIFSAKTQWSAPRTVTLQKRPEGFGFSVRGDMPVIVADVESQSVAEVKDNSTKWLSCSKGFVPISLDEIATFIMKLSSLALFRENGVSFISWHSWNALASV